MLMSSPIHFSGAIYNISWYLLRASKDQDYRDSNSNWIGKAERKKEGRVQRRENNPRLHSRLLAETGKEPW